MSFLQRFATRTRLVASDSWNLASILLKARPTTIPSARAALMQCARSDNGNIVAESALRFDREVGLMRYHGFGGYVTAKGGVRALLLPSPPSSGDTTSGFNLTRFLFGPPSGHGRVASVCATDIDSGTGTARSTDATSSAKKARVAFMITATQRQKLSAELGYTAGDIRSLKPLEALLILEHKLRPGNEEEVNRLVNENERLERQEAERAEREMTASAVEVEELDAPDIGKDALHTTANTQGHTANSTDEDKATLALAAGANANENQDAEPFLPNQNNESGTSLSSAISDQSAAVQQALSRPLSGDDQAQDVPNDIIGTTSMIDESDGMTWYEVVETKVQASPTSDEAVIALYQTLDEAEDCLKWKEERGEGKFTYQIRQRT